MAESAKNDNSERNINKHFGESLQSITQYDNNKKVLCAIVIFHSNFQSEIKEQCFHKAAHGTFPMALWKCSIDG